ncbi:hypothetical protein [Halalkalibacterium halodurans]|uniref:hypothetical protein n=1 Tax=Halalkalibacterium halodurans TaxID=86665 RepID=UPI002AA9ADC7|nr:hypothetical protein [Halalkalibacterium halodurans]MDY7221268.1 hypothetical protein [Halalkalibacterium halodurans]MDY7240507.1 hypothetical protein [Halalkalibacterium halodurans]
MSKTRTLFIDGMLGTILLLTAASTVSDSINHSEELRASAETTTGLYVYDTSDDTVKITKEDLMKDTRSLRTYDLIDEEPLTENVHEMDGNEIIYLDELSEEVSSDILDIGSVLNISQTITGEAQAVFNTQINKRKNSTISWDIVWDGKGDVRIGVVGSDDIFYYLIDGNGTSTRKLKLTKTQDYRFAIQNLDSDSATFSGWREM